MSLATLLPLAFVMVLGVEIVAAIFLVTSDNWVRNSLALLAGSAVMISALVAASFILLNGGIGEKSENKTIYWIVLGLLLAAALHVFLKRKTSSLPKWMSGLEGASAGASFKIGILMYLVLPPGNITAVAVGSYLAAHGDPLWHCLGFLALTLLVLAVPFLVRLVFHDRAKSFLPKVRDWMNSNSWIVNEFVLVFLMLLTVSSMV
jgi:hypothetical protein